MQDYDQEKHFQVATQGDAYPSSPAQSRIKETGQSLGRPRCLGTGQSTGGRAQSQNFTDLHSGFLGSLVYC